MGFLSISPLSFSPAPKGENQSQVASWELRDLFGDVVSFDLNAQTLTLLIKNPQDVVDTQLVTFSYDVNTHWFLRSHDVESGVLKGATTRSAQPSDVQDGDYVYVTRDGAEPETTLVEIVMINR